MGGNPQSASFYPFPDNAPQLIVVDLHNVDEEVDNELDEEVGTEMAASLAFLSLQTCIAQSLNSISFPVFPLNFSFFNGGFLDTTPSPDRAPPLVVNSHCATVEFYL